MTRFSIISAVSAVVCLSCSTAWAQAHNPGWNFDKRHIGGAKRNPTLNFDERLIAGEPAKSRPRTKVHRDDYKTLVPADAEPDQVVRQARQRVAEANARYSKQRDVSDAIRRDASALYRHAMSRYQKLGRVGLAKLAEAQALRQEGDYDAMERTLEEVLAKHRASPAFTEAAVLLGDHNFDRGKLEVSRRAYERILTTGASPHHDLARYKLAWIDVNEGNCSDALKQFKAVVESTVTQGLVQAGAGAKSVDVRAAALEDMVFCASRESTPDETIAFIESAPLAQKTRRQALAALARRYRVMEQRAGLLKAYEKLHAWTTEPDLRRDLSKQIKSLRKQLGSQP